MRSHTIGLHEVGPLGGQIGAGGQAKVFLAPAITLDDVAGPLVYKQYKPGHEPPHGLSAVVARRLRMDVMTRSRLDRLAAWPVRIVEQGGAVSGVLMPLIPSGFFENRVLPSGQPKRTLREVQHLFIDPGRAARLGMPAPTDAERLTVCRDFAAALHLLHRNELVIGDINAKNAVFRLDARPCVVIVDCDAIRIKGAAAVVRQLNAPDWEPPEDTLSQATDLYKFGLFVLRCLGPGPMASVSRDPARADAVLAPEGRKLLRASLSRRPADRPTAQDWGRYLDGLLIAPRRQSTPPPPPPAATSTPGWKRDPRTKRWVQAT
ncbi:hypothetical protein SAMN05216188_10965 [Lentzea xinjiangensis]|uniref:Protein kinase domain-containing protein n=1 Tax=Lentzea xinjiangensis TaxID=402600 RepID=A0A1H9MHI5_9PSEU|nr:hypothetical protein [Lentzea xinjiangensis]SER23118.1 hypothetical protein SAMN05216188_10965 [Lentzea xinjiangensis]